MKAYLDAKFEDLHVHVQRDISSAKRSILYDLNNKIDSIKNTLVAMYPGTQAICSNATEFREALDVALPVKTLEGFFNFEQMLNEHDGKKDALRALYRVLIFGETTAKGCIAKIMSATLTKAVEGVYSGTGRKIHGTRKLDFSETQTFNCLREVITISSMSLKSQRVWRVKSGGGCPGPWTVKVAVSSEMLSRHKRVEAFANVNYN